MENKTTTGQFHQEILQQWRDLHPDDVILLGINQDEGPNALYKGKRALVSVHGRNTSIKFAPRIKRFKGSTLYEKIQNGEVDKDSIDIAISLSRGWNNLLFEDFVPFSKIQDQFRRYSLHPENYEKDVFTYEDGNKSLILDKYILNAIQPLANLKE